MVSHNCAGGDLGIVVHGQASPRGMPSIDVREAGQIEDRPSMRTDQSVAMDTTGTDDACVVGCEMMKSDLALALVDLKDAGSTYPAYCLVWHPRQTAPGC